MKINPRQGGSQIAIRTHEETGIKVHFRRVGFVEKTKLAGSASSVGEILAGLMEPGVGVQKWEGVTQKVGDGEAVVPYGLAALDAVCQQCPAFGGWFNGHLLDVSGLRPAADEDAEGNSNGHAAGSEAAPARISEAPKSSDGS